MTNSIRSSSREIDEQIERNMTVREQSDGLISDENETVTRLSDNRENAELLADEETRTDDDETSSTTSTTNKLRKRHGSRNQHKMIFFVRWVMQTFPQLDQYKKDGISLQDTPIVVDVAGGKGECTARLSMCHRLRVVLVDPRPSDPAECFHKTVLPRLPRVWRDRVRQKLQAWPSMVQDTMNERVNFLQMCMTHETVETNEELQRALQGAAVILGMHADGATEPIVDAALKYRKPFCVVPCCVFPNLFQNRYIQVLDEETKEMKRIRVRSTDQFCQYLLDKDPRFQKSVLPMEGSNVAIWWDGKE